ncbi:Protein of unknown function [Cotesia congregata]|uniref:Uncharacterized protein n=1 Tax=Cotesia congregata TaxID=51543 RepID=A0A8J2HQB0_COTCN|nr:Protein of unknown function [Cotesia congregata]
MAPTPRRRGFRRNQHSIQDNAVAESQHSEASIYRISRAPSSPRPTTSRPSLREIGAKLYPVSHKSLEPHNREHTHVSDDLGTEDIVRLKPLMSVTHHPLSDKRINGNTTKPKSVSRKVIGVSVTSTVEATPYKVRVEHYDNEQLTMITRPPISGSSFAASSNLAATGIGTGTAKSGSMITTETSTWTTSTIPTPVKTSTVKTSTPIPAKLVTEELTNIVSESNRSEFSVDEGLPRTSWRARSSVTPESTITHSVPFSTSSSFPKSQEHKDSLEMATGSEPVEQSYELPDENSEIHEVQDVVHLQARKAGRHYDSPLFNQPPKVYPQPSKIYGKPSRIYGEPSKVYSEPAKVYGEPEKVYSEPSKIYIYAEPEKVYGEPAKIYSKPARVYSEPAKVYSEPAKVYSEPSKIYGLDGQPINHEPEEENYEVDEAVSVGSNGNVHGPQVVTEAPNSSAIDTSEDGHNKVGYVVEGRNYRKYRVEERTPDGFIVGEYGVVSHDDGSLRGVRYTADGTINPRLIYDALMKFLAL